MEDSVWGSRLLENWLSEVRTAVEREGELTEAAIQKLVKGFGGKPNILTRELEELRLRLQDNPEGLDDTSLRQKKKTQALAFLDRKLSRFQLRIDECEEREASEDAARQAAAVLPSTDVLDKILRYEAKLERQLYRAMAQLERLQRMRKGEAVPAPLTMVV
jgi:DNA repair ATPase RecN